MKGRIVNRKIVLEYWLGYMRIIEFFIVLFLVFVFLVFMFFGELNDVFFFLLYF